jgi:hypothetical protein
MGILVIWRVAVPLFVADTVAVVVLCRSKDPKSRVAALSDKCGVLSGGGVFSPPPPHPVSQTIKKRRTEVNERLETFSRSESITGTSNTRWVRVRFLSLGRIIRVN